MNTSSHSLEERFKLKSTITGHKDPISICLASDSNITVQRHTGIGCWELFSLQHRVLYIFSWFCINNMYTSFSVALLFAALHPILLLVRSEPLRNKLRQVFCRHKVAPAMISLEENVSPERNMEILENVWSTYNNRGRP